MQPFSRETIVDRRQPALRWGPLIAGAAVAIGSWMVLQLFGTGVAMSVLDPYHVEEVRGIGIGSSAWSVLALVVSMFLGGMLAGRLAGNHSPRVAGLHGVLVWALTSFVGFVVISAAVAIVAPSWHQPADPGGAPSAHGLIDRALDPINARLAIEGKPQLSHDQLITAAARSGPQHARFISALDEATPLTRPESEAIAGQLGPDVIAAAHRVGEHRMHTITAARATGCVFLIASFALALGLVAAIGGALLAARELVRRRGWSVEPTHTTAPYPVPPPPADVDVDDEDVQ
jgi:hypothetical protein